MCWHSSIVSRPSENAALESAVVVGGVSALGAALSQTGVPKDQVIKYETALRVDKYVLLVHGSAEDVEGDLNLLAVARPASVGATFTSSRFT